MTTRQEKVKHLLKIEVSDILRREMKDPRLGGFVTVTDAEVTADLRHAKVFVSVLGDEAQRKSTMKGLKSAQGFVRTEFAKRARMKVIPDIQFYFDESVDQGVRIFELLQQIHKDEDDEESA